MILLYFNPDVWGTVSDWFMVIVTTITAYYLYNTFQSQKEVQETQNNLFKIENIRFRESIKPLFKYIKSLQNFAPDEQKFDVIAIEITNENESIANNISLDFEKTKTVERTIIPQDYTIAHTKYLKKGDKPIMMGFLILDKKTHLENFKFEVNYHDVSGVKYSQTVFCLLVEKEFNIYPQLPIIIE